VEYKKAKPAPAPVQLEVCVNMWWFVEEETGLVYRVAGRGYALAGDDESKLSILKKLALTDFHVAENHKIPNRFTLSSEHGTIHGVVPASAINEHPEIFEPVYLAIEKNFPLQFRSVDSEYEQYKMEMPQDPLCVLTCVVEGQDGSLTPLVA